VDRNKEARTIRAFLIGKDKEGGEENHRQVREVPETHNRYPSEVEWRGGLSHQPR
jgi:hypothetical protein